MHQLVASLLGGGAADGLASAIGRFSGAGESAGSSLLGLLGPVVTSAFGDHR